MNRITLLAALAATCSLAACGGGGGSEPPPPPPPPPSTGVTVALSGVAAKGLMAGADVGVYAVNADGTLAATALATATTRADGGYSLSFSGTQGLPYVVKVVANAATTHLDEVTGAAQALPAGFTMRSVLVPASSGTLTAVSTVTPFSELAVAAAAKASGGINAANAAQAASTVKQLLGFDPAGVAVKSTSSAGSADEQKLAVLLTAVSKLAGTGGLGCSTGTAGEKAKCVVDTLGNAASLTTLKLTVGTGAAAVDVSAALTTAITNVLADPVLAGSVPPTALATVMANLGCTSNCNAGSSGGAGTAATAIAGARLLFGQIKTDWSAMFSRGGVIGGGAINKEALAFDRAMSGVQAPVDVLGKDLGSLLMGIDLYNDYLAGRTTVSSLGHGYDGLVSNDGSGNFSTTPATGCTLYTDDTTTVQATSIATAKVIGCGARYFVSRSAVTGGSATTEWRHGFTIVPNTDGSFDYSVRARRRVQTCIGSNCTITANQSLQVDPVTGNPLPSYTGKLTPVLSAALGSIRSFTLAGELPAAFKSGTRTLINLKHAVNLNGSVSIEADGTQTSQLAGSIVAYKTDGTVEGTLTVKTGILKFVPVSGAGNEPSEGDIDLVWNAGGSEFEGRLALTDSVQDISKSLRTPTKWVLSGALRNIVGSTSTEFLRGAFTIGLTGIAGYDDTRPVTATNNYTVNVNFVGAVSASARPTLEFTLGSSATAFDTFSGVAPNISLQYRTLVGSTPKLVVALTASTNASGVTTTKLSEATSNVSMSWVGDSPATVDLFYADTTKIGTLNTGSGILTFSDSSFISLDLGL